MSLSHLMWLNFFIADVQDGLGPYLGVFLKQKGFLESEIGLISTIASLCALILLIPFGILIDKTRYKRSLIALCIIGIATSSLLNYIYHSFIFTLLAQLSIALCGAFIGPSLAAITLGITGNTNYAKQVSKNEAYKHAGTTFSAIISFGFALYYGIASIFIITILMSFFSLVFLFFLKDAKIDHKIARGETKNHTSSLANIFRNPPIILLGAVLFCFHLSNAYMLPLLSQRAYSLGVDSTGAYASATIIIAQSTMILVALICGKLNAKYKHHLNKIAFMLMSIALFGLIVRGFIAANFHHLIGMIIVQLLDGIGAGIVGVILPILAARFLQGSGCINTGLSFVIMLGGIGGSLSGLLGGFIAQYIGYSEAYMVLGLIALGGLILWIYGFSKLKRLNKL